mmetsp:Transcript_5344/g.7381  ORF Transcript_5344/g.7381 Transcript_5344/m.7381 type:complete len:201 (+) Transcript_5344:549-1151(+)
MAQGLISQITSVDWSASPVLASFFRCDMSARVKDMSGFLWANGWLESESDGHKWTCLATKWTGPSLKRLMISINMATYWEDVRPVLLLHIRVVGRRNMHRTRPQKHDGQVVGHVSALAPQTPHRPLFRVHEGELDLVEQNRTQRLQLIQTNDHTLRVHLRCDGHVDGVLEHQSHSTHVNQRSVCELIAPLGDSLLTIHTG